MFLMRVLRVRLWPILLLVLAQTLWADSNTLRVGVSPDYAPLNFKRDGQVVGIEADNAQQVAKALGMSVQTVEMPFGELIPALMAGDIDVIMSGMSVTPERAELVTFAKPFMEIGQMAIILQDNAARFAHPRALFLGGIRIGVEPGTTGEAYVRDTLPRAQLQNYENAEQAFAALRVGEVDVYIHDAPTSWQLANARENEDLLSLYRPLTKESLAWAVRKDNAMLLGQLNWALDELRAKTVMQNIQNHWIPVTIKVN